MVGVCAKARLVPLLLGWVVYCAVLTTVEFGSLCAVLGSPGAGFWEPPLTFYLLNLSQCVAILGTLWILRAIGFRMVRMPAHGGD